MIVKGFVNIRTVLQTFVSRIELTQTSLPYLNLSIIVNLIFSLKVRKEPE